MKRPSPPAALPAQHHLGALLLGLLLGQGVTLMAQQGSAGWAGFGFSTLLVAATSASFVLAVLGLRQKHHPASRAVLSRQAHALALVIGVGLLASLTLGG